MDPTLRSAWRQEGLSPLAPPARAVHAGATVDVRMEGTVSEQNADESVAGGTSPVFESGSLDLVSGRVVP